MTEIQHDETITWYNTREVGLPEESGEYLITFGIGGMIAYKILDKSCPRCERHWREMYSSWAYPPTGWTPEGWAP